MFELFDHTADLGLRVRADTLADLLAEAGRGLLAMHVANPEAVQAQREKTIELTADDPSYLLFDWLSELLYAFESEKLLLAEFDIEVLPVSGVDEHAHQTASGVRELPDEEESAENFSHREADASRSPDDDASRSPDDDASRSPDDDASRSPDNDVSCSPDNDVSCSPYRLRATCRGELRDDRRHVLDHEVKAITYHGLAVQQMADGSWQGEVIVDI